MSRAQVTSLSLHQSTTQQQSLGNLAAFWRASSPGVNPHWLIQHHSANLTSKAGKIVMNSTDFLRFHFNNFRYSLTLFSKFFASFPHGTCTLSVSHQYLALDGIYHQIWAAIPSNSTRRKHMPRHKISRQEREFHPLSCPFPRDLARKFGRQYFSRPQFGAPEGYADSHGELFPLHSPLLGESLLVSFPPLNYMLKFSG